MSSTVNMSVGSDVADYVWLTGSEAAALLTELTASCEPLHKTILRLRKSYSAARSHLLLEQVELRRRAAAKFTHAAQMFFTRTALEQGTDEWIARYKASRFAGERAGASPPPAVVTYKSPTVIADLCCGIGGDLMALGKQGQVIGVDRDPIATYFAQKNCEAVLGEDAAQRVTLVTTNVDDFDLRSIAAWHIDPDRRATGRRTTSLEHFTPDLTTIERLLRCVSHAAIKLAPATRVPSSWESRFELEWISRSGECRQLVAWHGDFAPSTRKRRATVVSTSVAGALEVCSFTGEFNLPIRVAKRPDQFVFDIDPAVLAAGLKGALAVKHKLTALGAGPTYMTGPNAIQDAMLSCFRVEEILPMRVRSLSNYLRECDIGRLEIKKRGIDIEPEKLRRELKLRGDNQATLLITPIAGRPAAILARRVLSC